MSAFSDLDTHITEIKICSKCRGSIYLQPKIRNTTYSLNVNTPDNYTCPTCKTTTFTSNNECIINPTEAIKPLIARNKRENYKQARCKICRGSGFDRKGKPCRDCSPEVKKWRTRWWA